MVVALRNWLSWSWRTARPWAALSKEPMCSHTPWRSGSRASNRVPRAAAWMPMRSAVQWSTSAKIVALRRLDEPRLGVGPVLCEGVRPCAVAPRLRTVARQRARARSRRAVLRCAVYKKTPSASRG
jgi:hypothetical protein